MREYEYDDTEEAVRLKIDKSPEAIATRVRAFAHLLTKASWELDAALSAERKSKVAGYRSGGGLEGGDSGSTGVYKSNGPSIAAATRHAENLLLIHKG